MNYLRKIVALERDTLQQLENEMYGFNLTNDATPEPNGRNDATPKPNGPDDANAEPNGPDGATPKPNGPDETNAKPKNPQDLTPENSGPKIDNAMVPKSIGPDVVDDVLKRIEESLIFLPDHGFMKRCAYTESHFGVHEHTFEHLDKETGKPVPYYGGIWQVDWIGLKDTKSNHAALKRKHAEIKEKFGIDWLEVKHEDLWKPLYSGLAARLLMSNKTQPIPQSIEDQATYYKTHYNSDAKDAKGSAEKFIKDTKHMEANFKKQTK